MNFSVILTSFKEPTTIKQAIERIVQPNLDLVSNMQLIVVAPDNETLEAAQDMLREYEEFSSHKVIKDSGNGKPAAINLAVKSATGEILILTDGDMHISHNAIKGLIRHFESEEVGGVSGHPVSLDDRKTQFGYYSHLFCEAAHQKRLVDKHVPMSGYLYGIRNIKNLFPIPEDIRAEDAYLSTKIAEAGYKIQYEPEALAYVRFPKNFSDWIKQKKRSLGGNVQATKITAAENQRSAVNSAQNSRSIWQDLGSIFFPIQFARNPRELWFSLLLYPLRLYLWTVIYLQHFSSSYSKGQWERIESSKS